MDTGGINIIIFIPLNAVTRKKRFGPGGNI
jgi:hypothetical protein